MMTHQLAALALLLCAGCGVTVSESEPEPAPAAKECPTVACAFDQGVCDPTDNTYVEHTLYDDGKGCYMKSAACFPKSTPAGCEPADCYSETSLACH